MRRRRAPVLGWASRSPALAVPRSQPRALRDPAGGHGDSAPLARGRPRTRAGMAAAAAERAGPGPRLPAPPRLPGSGLRARGERSRAERGCGGRRGRWGRRQGGRRRVEKRCQRGGSWEDRRECEGLSKVRRTVGCAKGRTAQAPAGGRAGGGWKPALETRRRSGAWAQRGGALARTPGVESRAVRGSSRETPRAAVSLVGSARPSDSSVWASELEDGGTGGWQLRMDRDLERGPWQELNRSGLAPNSSLPEYSPSSSPMLRRPSLALGSPQVGLCGRAGCPGESNRMWVERCRPSHPFSPPRVSQNRECQN